MNTNTNKGTITRYHVFAELEMEVNGNPKSEQEAIEETKREIIRRQKDVGLGYVLDNMFSWRTSGPLPPSEADIPGTEAHALAQKVAPERKYDGGRATVEFTGGKAIIHSCYACRNNTI